MRDWMARRLHPYGASVFAEMSALAREVGAVNLGQGFPDFDGPVEARDAIREALEAGRNQYAVSHGEAALRHAIAAHAQRFYGQSVDPDAEITVTSGASEAIWLAAFAFVEPGDEVILFEPFFDTYVPNIQMAGGTVVPITLRPPHFRPDPDELRAAFGPKTKMILVNTPHNPTGTVLNDEELALIAELCQEWEVMALTDEVYEHIVFSESTHRRLATLPGMAERTLTLSSGGKTFSATGWKIGWAIGPAHFQAAMRRLHQFTVFASTTPMQYGIAAALALPAGFYLDLATQYEARRDYLLEALRQTPLVPYAPQGAYFILADSSAFPQPTSEAFCRWLVKEVGVAAIPPATFYLTPGAGDHLVRFTFCKQWDTLERAAERLSRL